MARDECVIYTYTCYAMQHNFHLTLVFIFELNYFAFYHFSGSPQKSTFLRRIYEITFTIFSLLQDEYGYLLLIKEISMFRFRDIFLRVSFRLEQAHRFTILLKVMV